MRKQVSSKIREEVKLKNDSKINSSSNKSSAAWKILKDSTGMTKSQHEINSLNVDGSEETIKLNIVNTLNQTFLVPPPDNPTPPGYYEFVPPVCGMPFILCPTSESEIYTVICS